VRKEGAQYPSALSTTANHGFNCDPRGCCNAGAAATALERSLYHFGKHLG